MTYEVPDWLAEAVSAFGEACKERLDGTGEPEAAVRPPIEALMQATGSALSLHVVEHGESALDDLQVKPDYAIRVNGVITGYIEVKKPHTDIDPESFTGHNRSQWERLLNLPNLVYTNGQSWALFRNGELTGERASLDGDLYTAGSRLKVRDDSFELLLRNFLTWKPVPITSVTRLVRAVAPLCLLLRREVVDQLAREERAIRTGRPRHEQPFTGLAADWRGLLFPTASDDTFADGYAQAVTFALLLARAENIAIADRSLHEIGNKLSPGHSLMGRALQILTDYVSDAFRVTLDLMVRVISAVDWERIRAGHVDAYLHLYEHFLGEYDEALRRASGSYYTPRDVVVEMVRLAEAALRSRLGRPRGFMSPDVVTIDPAMGTGTYLLSIIHRVAEQASAQEGPGAAPGAVSQVIRRLIGFELQMGPYAVAELRTSDLVRKYGAVLPRRGISLFVTDTLDDPHQEQTQLASTYAPLARSRREANRVKVETPVTVAIGNPPYRERAEGLGGWVERGSPNVPAPLDAFRLAGNGRFEYVLKNLYVYFWRWATWKVFDAHEDHRHGIVCFISTSGYLRGPGFKGMREYLRRSCEEGWIINVSPEGHRPDVPTRVFPGVQQPLAIGLFLRRIDTDETPAQIWYTEVHGRRSEKYEQLSKLTLDGPAWRAARTDWHAPFTPAADSEWDAYPALSDLIPWTTPGVKSNRGWVYAPSPEILKKRWNKLVTEVDPQRKALLFKETTDRQLDSRVDALPSGFQHLGTLANESGPCPNPTRVGYRSFDRQWIIPDRRLIDRPRPELWAAQRDKQIFVVEQHAQEISSGPGLVFTSLVPDMHYFNVRGGRVLPMLHPDGSPNVGTRLLTALADRLGVQTTVEDLVAYVAAIVAHPGFTERFIEELVTPGIRVPITADSSIWMQAVDLGRELLWTSTYGAVMYDSARSRPPNSIRYPGSDPRSPRNTVAIPGRPLPAQIRHEGETLHVGDGCFAPVPEAVWRYDVGGMNVLKTWFSHRSAHPGGRVTSDLDRIHIETWPYDWTRDLNDLLTVLRRLTELEPRQRQLLDSVLASSQITVADLTSAGVFPVPATARRPRRAASIGGDGTLYADT